MKKAKLAMFVALSITISPFVFAQSASAQDYQSQTEVIQSKAGVFTWVDKKGVKHYGDASTSPKSAKYVSVKVSQPNLVNSSNQADSASSGAPSSDAQSKTPCEEAQSRVDMLADNDAALKIKRSNGDVEDLSADERAARLVGAKAEASSICKS